MVQGLTVGKVLIYKQSPDSGLLYYHTLYWMNPLVIKVVSILLAFFIFI